jgi:very-short-patch-repair endonuclease
MSRADALRDGIKYDDNGYRLLYYVPCQNCGKIHGRRKYTGKEIYLCPACLELKHAKQRAEVEALALSMPDAETKEEKRYRSAVEAIEKQVGSLKGYEKAVDICRKATYKYGSIPEAMLAIELIRKGYRIIPQQKVGKYRVDFALPNEKLIIEVDGSLYHANKQKELEREASINYAIGLDWRFIHIPAESISKDVRRVVRLLKHRDTGDN